MFVVRKFSVHGMMDAACYCTMYFVMVHMTQQADCGNTSIVAEGLVIDHMVYVDAVQSGCATYSQACGLTAQSRGRCIETHVRCACIAANTVKLFVISMGLTEGDYTQKHVESSGLDSYAACIAPDTVFAGSLAVSRKALPYRMEIADGPSTQIVVA